MIGRFGKAWRAATFVACCFACAAPEPTPRDVIVVTLDTTRQDHLGVYGYGRDTSPSLDAFAREAVTFERAFAAGAWTLPTHASILTGRWVSNHGARFDVAANTSLSEVFEGEFFAKHKANRLHEDEVTLAELLTERGYATALFAGGPWLAPPFGLAQGYQNVDAEIDSVAGQTAEALTDRFLAWLATVPPEQPVHALVNYFDPHSPWEPPPGFDDLPGTRIPLDPKQDQVFVNGGARLSAEQRVALIDRYDGEIRYMDFHLGRLLAGLKRAGRHDDALIVIVGDHGELFGEHGVIGHGRWLYEPVLRVPLLVRYPGARGGGRVETAVVSQVDLLPLIAAEIALPLPAAVDGVPVGERTRAFAEAFRDPFSVNHYGSRYDRDLFAWVRWPWKLIATDDQRLQLFDLAADRAEQHPRRDPEVGRSLVAELDAQRAALKPRAGSAPPTDVPARLQRELQQLGYIE